FSKRVGDRASPRLSHYVLVRAETTIRIFDEVSRLVFSVRPAYSSRQAVVSPMRTERHPEMNSGDRPKYFDRGSRLCYRRPWRRPGATRRLFLSPPSSHGALKFWGENHHELTVVAPTGFEPVFTVRHALAV